MENEELILELKKLKLYISQNSDLITGEKLLCYADIDKIISMLNHARIRRRMK